jgi:hypothetical protein
VFGVCPFFVSADQPLAIYSEVGISDDVACWQDIGVSQNYHLYSYCDSKECIYKTRIYVDDMSFDYKPQNNGEQVTKVPFHSQDYAFGYQLI